MGKLSVTHNSQGWTYDDISNLIDTYTKNGGYVYEIEEGCLGYGLTILYDLNHKLKTIVIQEYYINEWTSGHKVKMYNKCPKKYEKMLERIEVF